MATQDQVDQQHRVIVLAKQRAEKLLNDLSDLQASLDTYNQLGLSDDQILGVDSFNGTGVTVVQYRAAITSITAFLALLPQGHGTNLQSFSR